jgi:ABC-type siderophore export system fused ATPase/permease subunit
MTIDQPSQPARPESRKFRGKLARNLLFVVLILTIIPTFIMGLVSYLRTRTLLIDQITEQLNTIVVQETQELDNWLLKKDNDLSKIGNNQEFQSAVLSLINNEAGSGGSNSAYGEIKEALSSNNFDELLVLDANGIVWAATKEEWESLDLHNEESIDLLELDEGNSSFITISPILLYPQIENPNSVSNKNSNIILITPFQLSKMYTIL